MPNGFFGLKFKKKIQNRKVNYHWILYNQNSLGIKFLRKLKILNFRTKFVGFQLKTKKLNATIEFCILESV